MKQEVSTTSKSKKKSQAMKEKFLKETKVGQFVGDVKDAEIAQFDVTNTKGFIQELITRFRKVDVMGLAAQLAFFFLLSLFPLLIFIFTLLPYLNLDQAQILLYIHEYAPGSVAQLLEDTLGEVLNNRNGKLLSFGIIATIWSASKGMNALTQALNRSYFQEESRSFFIARGMSIIFTVMLIGVLIVALALPVFGQQIGSLLLSYIDMESHFLQLWEKFRWLVSVVLIYTVFSLIYWLVPDLKIFYKSVILGSIIATIGWIITSLGFSFYVGNYANYSNTYGSIGGIIVLMLWLYLSAIILMIGGQVNAVMRDRKNALHMKDTSRSVHAE